MEFLALLAFAARERQRLRMRSNPHTKFTASDLEMAYAFRQQFQGGPAGAQRSRARYTDAQLHSPQHTSPSRSLSPQFPVHTATSPPSYQLSPSKSVQPFGRQPQTNRMAQLPYVPRKVMVKSPTESSIQSQTAAAMHPPINLNASMIASPQVPTFSPTSIRRPTSNLNPHQFSPYHVVPRLHTGMEGVHTGDIPNQPSELQSYHAQRQRELVTRRQAGLAQNVRGFDQFETNGKWNL